MGFKVSSQLLSGLAPADRNRKELENKLWLKTGGLCFLCEDDINRAAEDYEADHDHAEANGGATSIENLHLAHSGCNRIKRAANSKHIRPYIKFLRYYGKLKTRINYDGTLDFFKIKPFETDVQIGPRVASFKFSDDSRTDARIFHEKNEKSEFTYVYVEVPRDAIWNDFDCQPRNIKKEQVSLIYNDIRTNPLHEPPSVRLSDPKGGMCKLLMFDGQHKTVSAWLAGRQRLVVKVYLNLSAEAARELVNSIQAKIKKLPLSPFEMASKLAEEWEDKLTVYEKAMGEGKASEAGFIDWLPADDRLRAKQAFRSALIQRLLGDPELRLVQYAKGAQETPIVELTEQAIRSKVLEKLVHTDPLPQVGDELSGVRDREAANILRVLNHFVIAAFETQGDGQPTDIEMTRARRIGYQQSLAYCAGLIKDLWGNIAMKGSALKFVMSDELTEEQWKRMTIGIDRLVAHPAWVQKFEGSADLMELKVALEKNQQASDSFEKLALDLPYVLTGEKYPAYKNRWGTNKK
jgi:hypothetical protein